MNSVNGFTFFKREDFNFDTKKNKIATGWHAEVYEGTCTYFDKPIAVKVFTSVDSPKQTLVEEYQKKGAFLDHPNLLKIYGTCHKKGRIFGIMELMNMSLAQKVQDLAKNKSRLSLRDISHITEKITMGIGHLHSKEITHLNLRPNNILLSEDLKEVKISDTWREVLYKNYRKKPLVNYESLRWKDVAVIFSDNLNTELKKKADIYAIGILIWHQITGRVPFELIPSTSRELRNEALKTETIPDDCPRFYAHLIQKCWNKAAAERPTALEIQNYLQFFEKHKLLFQLFSENKMKDIYRNILVLYLIQLSFPSLVSSV